MKSSYALKKDFPMQNIAVNADCLEAMREYPDNYFDLAVCDPPYGGGCSQSLNVERERESKRGRGV